MIIELPNGQELEFPDGTSPDVMRQAIYKHFPDYAPKEASQEKPRAGLSGIGQDIKESVSGIPDALASFVSNLPHEAYESGKQLIKHPIRATENLGAGLLEGVKGAYNLPLNIAEYLGEKNIPYFKNIEPLVKKFKIGDTGVQKSVLGNAQEGDALLQSLASFAPYAKLGGLARGLQGASGKAATAAAYAAGQDQDPLQAALMGLAGEGVTKGLQKISRPGAFLPSSPLSNEELQEAARKTAGTETSLGNVIENPFLKQQFENVLSNTPLSGANQAMQRTANLITERGENLLNDLKGGYEDVDVGNALKDALVKASTEARDLKNEKFQKLNEAAAKEGIKTERPNLRKAASEILGRIDSDKDLKQFSNSSLVSLLKELSQKSYLKGQSTAQKTATLKTPGEQYVSPFTGEKNFTPPEYEGLARKTKGSSDAPRVDVITGKPLSDKFSLQKTDFLRGELGDLAHDAYLSNNTALSKVYTELKKAADKDINQSIESSNNPELIDLRNDAMDFYKKHYAPFEDPDIMKFTRRGGDTDLLVNAFLKNSRLSDRSKILSKLTSKLTDEERKLLAYSYFSKAITDGKLNPLKLKTLYKNLGEKQRKALLGEGDEINQLRDYTDLIEKNTEPLNIMFNPPTGKRGLSQMPWLPVMGSAIGSLMTGSLPGGLAAAVLPGLAAKPLVKLLSNPNSREKLIQKMIKSREKQERTPANLAPFVQALTQANQKNKDKD